MKVLAAVKKIVNNSSMTPTSSSNSIYPIVVLQYERADCSFGQEENLHWALIVITSVNESNLAGQDDEEILGPCWQVFDRHYSDGRGVVWELFDGKIVHPEEPGTRCIGGVKIGEIEERELVKLRKILDSHQPIPTFDGWNCRDWVVEVILSLHQTGPESNSDFIHTISPSHPDPNVNDGPALVGSSHSYPAQPESKSYHSKPIATGTGYGGGWISQGLFKDLPSPKSLTQETLLVGLRKASVQTRTVRSRASLSSAAVGGHSGGNGKRIAKTHRDLGRKLERIAIVDLTGASNAGS
ncbi:hypothetical protein C8R42DRAFT_425662 [Lentinula raphanica]|nr:hypothetical protein C8R42DRAFT_425662 [Lentinula raphanica]